MTKINDAWPDFGLKHCCKNCIWHKLKSWYDEEGVEIDYCEMNECKIEDVEQDCWRFTSVIPVRKIGDENDK